MTEQAIYGPASAVCPLCGRLQSECHGFCQPQDVKLIVPKRELTELEIAVAAALVNWNDLLDYPTLCATVVFFIDGWMPASNRTPGDPRYKAVEIEPIKEINDESYVY